MFPFKKTLLLGLFLTGTLIPLAWGEVDTIQIDPNVISPKVFQHQVNIPYLCSPSREQAPQNIVKALCKRISQCVPDRPGLNVYGSCLFALNSPVGKQLWDDFGLQEMTHKVSRLIRRGILVVQESNLCQCLREISQISCENVRLNFDVSDWSNIANLINEDGTCANVFSPVPTPLPGGETPPETIPPPELDLELRQPAHPVHPVDLVVPGTEPGDIPEGSGCSRLNFSCDCYPPEQTFVQLNMLFGTPARSACAPASFFDSYFSDSVNANQACRHDRSIPSESQCRVLEWKCYRVCSPISPGL